MISDLAKWKYFDDWSTCDVTCNTGFETRSEKCVNPDNTAATGDCMGVAEIELRPCDLDPCRKLLIF